MGRPLSEHSRATIVEVDKSEIKGLLLKGKLKKVPSSENCGTRKYREHFLQVCHIDDDAYSGYLSCKYCGEFLKFHYGGKAGTSVLSNHLNRCKTAQAALKQG
jgi:hypothetical protein